MYKKLALISFILFSICFSDNIIVPNTASIMGHVYEKPICKPNTACIDIIYLVPDVLVKIFIASMSPVIMGPNGKVIGGGTIWKAIDSTITDQNGEYIINNLYKSAYKVQFSKKGYVTQMTDYFYLNNDTTISVTIVKDLALSVVKQQKINKNKHTEKKDVLINGRSYNKKSYIDKIIKMFM